MFDAASMAAALADNPLQSDPQFDPTEVAAETVDDMEAEKRDPFEAIEGAAADQKPEQKRSCWRS